MVVDSRSLNHLDFLRKFFSWLMSGSSSIEVMDEETGTVHLVGPHYISSSSACKLITQSLFVVLLLSTMLHRLFY